jgi:hypothetical protein
VLQPVNQARSLVSAIKGGGQSAPKNFCSLLNILLKPLLAPNQNVYCRKAKEEISDGITQPYWVIEPSTRYRALKLQDRNYLLIHYEVDLDDHAYLSGRKSNIQYQLNAGPDNVDEIFRYDYERRLPVPAAPGSELLVESPFHLHVYATLKRSENSNTNNTSLEDRHFPCGKVSIESIVKMLLKDFDLKIGAENELANYLQILEFTEHEFDSGYGRKGTFKRRIDEIWDQVKDLLHLRK